MMRHGLADDRLVNKLDIVFSRCQELAGCGVKLRQLLFVHEGMIRQWWRWTLHAEQLS